MIRKILFSSVAIVLLAGAAFQYRGIRHDLVSVVTSGSARTLTNTSTQVQRFTGSTAQTVNLPNATTLGIGMWYKMINESSAVVSVYNNASELVTTLPAASQDAPVSKTLYITSTSTNGGPWTIDQGAGTGGGDAASVVKEVTQSSHGFTVGNVIRYTGTLWVKSQADADANSEVYGVVSEVIDTNNFGLTTSGYISGLSGLTAGSAMFLSPTTAGALTVTSTTTTNYVNKPVLLADSTTSGYVVNHRGYVVDGTSGTGGGVAQIVSTKYTTGAQGTTTIPFDNTIPQNTEGVQFMSQTITPTDASSTLEICAYGLFASTATGSFTIALFQDSTANALAANGLTPDNGTDNPFQMHICHTMTAGTTSATTFTIRMGNTNAGTVRMNEGSGGTDFYGGVASSIIIIKEYLP